MNDFSPTCVQKLFLQSCGQLVLFSRFFSPPIPLSVSTSSERHSHDPTICATLDGCSIFVPYLIFVISFTRAKFLKNEIFTEKRVNYKKRILRQNSVNQDLLGQAMNTQITQSV